MDVCCVVRALMPRCCAVVLVFVLPCVDDICEASFLLSSVSDVCGGFIVLEWSVAVL